MQNKSKVAIMALFLFFLTFQSAQAVQRAYIRGDYAIVYADIGLSAPIGKLSGGQEVIVGSVTRRNEQAVPLVISERIVWIDTASLHYISDRVFYENGRIIRPSTEEDMPLKRGDLTLLASYYLSTSQMQQTLEQLNVAVDANQNSLIGVNLKASYFLRDRLTLDTSLNLKAITQAKTNLEDEIDFKEQYDVSQEISYLFSNRIQSISFGFQYEQFNTLNIREIALVNERPRSLQQQMLFVTLGATGIAELSQSHELIISFKAFQSLWSNENQFEFIDNNAFKGQKYQLETKLRNRRFFLRAFVDYYQLTSELETLNTTSIGLGAGMRFH